ncbi:hypothetical protein M8C21_009484 [Ambrosia artemisiifolia]|uniref:Uncharacterized protein n=1 Tax=Ambrosia artemisiifolia TaxID=4212 RepID=A0AAD5BUK1_AMBAR|nr:hypothetical protein M8C21_009484 [Ambrosia artemisiifolia]
MRHMETWVGITKEKWNRSFPLETREKKAKLNLLRKRYAVRLMLFAANTH